MNTSERRNAELARKLEKIVDTEFSGFPCSLYGTAASGLRYRISDHCANEHQGGWSDRKGCNHAAVDVSIVIHSSHLVMIGDEIKTRQLCEIEFGNAPKEVVTCVAAYAKVLDSRRIAAEKRKNTLKACRKEKAAKVAAEKARLACYEAERMPQLLQLSQNELLVLVLRLGCYCDYVLHTLLSTRRKATATQCRKKLRKAVIAREFETNQPRRLL